MPYVLYGVADSKRMMFVSETAMLQCTSGEAGMDCILFRHGIAVEPQDWDGPEARRPLTAKGADKVREAADGLIRLDIEPTHLIASPFVRAGQTAEILREAFRSSPEITQWNELLPDAPPHLLFDRLAKLHQDACVICVGHEPHLSAAAGLMMSGGPVPGLVFKKSGACCLRFERMVKPGEAVLRWWLMPAQLRALGKS
jgi:phosphohistidine phosphatase